jgi:hypothetical protein
VFAVEGPKMTTQRPFKQRVRARMAKTGESYTAARRMLIADGDEPDPVAADWLPPVSDAAVSGATGRDWQAWLRVLDDWGAMAREHSEMAKWLREAHSVDGWWAQTISVGYERARNLRAPGQRADGWSVGATRTIAAAADAVFDAITDHRLLEGWLPGAEMRLRTSTRPRTARYDWEDGSTRVIFYITASGPSRSQLAIQHERLPDADTAEEMKRWWRDRISSLRSQLETPSP